MSDLALSSLSGSDWGLELGPLGFPYLSLRPDIHPAYCHRVWAVVQRLNSNSRCSCWDRGRAADRLCCLSLEVV